MKETTSNSMPPCFDRWCQKIDPVLKTKAQKREFRNYLGGLFGESERKNLSQIAHHNVDVVYHKLPHFLTESTWKYEEVNEKRLEIINSCCQTKISRDFFSKLAKLIMVMSLLLPMLMMELGVFL